jgi:hypothetical protein
MTEFDALMAAQRETADSVLELPLLISRQQMNKLAIAAQRQGLTSAQFLRKVITSLCDNECPGT